MRQLSVDLLVERCCQLSAELSLALVGLQKGVAAGHRKPQHWAWPTFQLVEVVVAAYGLGPWIAAGQGGAED